MFGGRPFDPVEDHRRGIAAVGTAHELDIGSLRPRAQLLGGCCPERVTGGEQHRTPGVDLLASELADGGRLADAVHAHEQPDVGRARSERVVEMDLPVGALEAADHVGLQRVEQLGRVVDLLRLDPCLQPVEQRLGDAEADIGPQQRLFEFVPRLVGDRRSAQDAGKRAGERRRAFANRSRSDAGAGVGTGAGSTVGSASTIASPGSTGGAWGASTGRGGAPVS